MFEDPSTGSTVTTPGGALLNATALADEWLFPSHDLMDGLAVADRSM